MKTHHSTLLLLFFFLFLTPSLSATSHRCHPSDYNALIKIKNSFDDPNPFPSWVPSIDCCEWYGPVCNETTGRVFKLRISWGTLSGQIPPEVADLPYLESLTFRKLTNLTGPIPRSITKLKKLRYLQLSWLNLTGPVPDFLTEITTLEFLDLNFNHFTGPVPASFSKFTRLVGLRLDRNRLTGSIPESFGHFTGSVPDMYLSHNQLTGSIPKSFANMDFQALDVSYNRLCGEIPTGGNMDRFGESSYIHNKCLCGPPLSTLCKKN